MTIDSVDRSVQIAATPERVWELVSRPGWWINDGDPDSNTIEHRDGYDLVTNPVHGTFPLVTVEQDPPHYVAFRWLRRSEDPQVDGPGTLTEFWIEPHPTGVVLRVRESGFATLPLPDADRQSEIEDNTSGWEYELDVARRMLSA